jgi:1-acyl-sn-glycerol-3-phosphate acyltransferase
VTPDETTEHQPPAEPADLAGWGVDFEPDPRRTTGYRMARGLFEFLVGTWFRPRVTGRANVPADGPVILAPMHRSFADFAFAAFITPRKLFFMTKADLWRNRFLGWLLVTLGAFPIHREATDREAMRRAEEVLRRGQVLVLFPEGYRKEGPLVQDLQEGAAFLAARTGAVLVPIGIANSDRAMPKGTRIPKPLKVDVVVGEPVPAPEKGESGRVPRRRIHATTEQLTEAIQTAYDEARIRSGH